MTQKITYTFTGKLWKYQGEAGWHFISLPTALSKEIRNELQWQEEGWGRMKAKAILLNHEWDTAIWFDKKNNSYLLPIKASIRNKLKLSIDQVYEINLML